MEVILDQKECDRWRDYIEDTYHFIPSPYPDSHEWIHPDKPFKKYRLKEYWNEQQEAVVNGIMCKVIHDDMIAMDWYSETFIFNPNEKITPGLKYRDFERNCNVYFPSYYPDGDYYFFFSMDWSSGLYGHPWRKEIIVVGEKMIRAFDEKMKELGLEVIASGDDNEE